MEGSLAAIPADSCFEKIAKKLIFEGFFWLTKTYSKILIAENNCNAIDEVAKKHGRVAVDDNHILRFISAIEPPERIKAAFSEKYQKKRISFK